MVLGSDSSERCPVGARRCPRHRRPADRFKPMVLAICSLAIDSTKVPASMVLAAAMKRLDGLCCAIGYIPQVYWVRLNPERP